MGVIVILVFFIVETLTSALSKDGLAKYQDNVSEWGNMSIHELLF